MSWVVYMIEDDGGSLYTGVTTSIARRFAEHSEGRRGARYFNGRKPRGVVFVETGHDRSSALRREAEIKRLSRQQKLTLLKPFVEFDPDE
jgi:putative endonuclease